METRKEKKAYAAPAIEFQTIMTDIIMCSCCPGGKHWDDAPGRNRNGGGGGHGGGGHGGGGHGGGGHGGGGHGGRH